MANSDMGCYGSENTAEAILAREKALFKRITKIIADEEIDETELEQILFLVENRQIIIGFLKLFKHESINL